MQACTTRCHTCMPPYFSRHLTKGSQVQEWVHMNCNSWSKSAWHEAGVESTWTIATRNMHDHDVKSTCTNVTVVHTSSSDSHQSCGRLKNQGPLDCRSQYLDDRCIPLLASHECLCNVSSAIKSFPNQHRKGHHVRNPCACEWPCPPLAELRKPE